MKSKYVVLTTVLLFPLTSIAQHGSSGSAGGGTSSSSSSGSYSSSSSSSSSGSHASSGGGSSASSGSSASRSSGSSSSAASRPSSGADSRSSAAQRGINGGHNSGSGQSKSNLIQSKDSDSKGKPTAGTPVAKDNVKKSWLPWRRHSDKLAQKGNGEEKKPKCKDGKPCKEENKLAKDDPKLKCIHGPCKVCPSGFSLNSKGVCVSAPQSTAYNCPPGSFNTGQAAGQPCASNFIQNNCSVLASEIQQEERALSMINSARRPVCAQDPAGQECLDLTSRYELELERLQALQEQYEACSRR